MESTIKLIIDFFEKGHWKYNYDDKKKSFSTGLKMNSAIGVLRIYIWIREESYIVSTVLDATAEEKCYSKVAEYIHRANYGMRNGNFEFNYDSGEVRYKTYVGFEGIQLSEEIVENSIIVPILMFEKYGKGLLRVMIEAGEPQSIIEEIEKDD